MSWQDLLQKPDEYITLPWVGGRELRARNRMWTLIGKAPSEHGWHTFEIHGRTAKIAGVRVDPVEPFSEIASGYLVGDLFAADDQSPIALDRIVRDLPRVHLIFEDGLERFARVHVGRIERGSPFIFAGIDMPRGPEDDVERAFQDRAPNLDHVKGVSPGLDAAFRMHVRRRDEDDARRAKLEEQRRIEEEKRIAEERRQGLIRQLGDGAGRRALAQVDFRTAATAALKVGGADLLDWRQAHGEHVVTYRLDGQRFQCTCDDTLRIVSAGICLVDHRTGRADDNLLTLESLPGVVRQAQREGKLVIFRHV